MNEKTPVPIHFRVSFKLETDAWNQYSQDYCIPTGFKGPANVLN